MSKIDSDPGELLQIEKDIESNKEILKKVKIYVKKFESEDGITEEDCKQAIELCKKIKDKSKSEVMILACETAIDTWRLYY